MKQNNILKFLYLFSLIVTISCSKDSVEETIQTTPGELATLTTEVPTSITPTAAISGGEIKTDGGLPVTARGLCWSTLANPTVELSTKSKNGFGIGNFTISVTKLKPSTTYYIRAYATNAKGTAYGNELVFTTLKEPLPTVTTTPITDIKDKTVKTGGEVIDDAELAIIERGVCWSINPNPTDALGTRLVDKTPGKEIFISDVTGLEPSKKYYIRAYARNSAGTSYGEEFTFTTLNQ